MRKDKHSYHHGNLAESLLDAVDELASKFGLEAVTLRACAKLVGVSPSSAFRHYADKRDLLTAFATRALQQLATAMTTAKTEALAMGHEPFAAVGMAYVRFALEQPSLFRIMWREEMIYSNDSRYLGAARQLSQHLQAGFAETLQDKDAQSFSPQELLAWSSVHGLASLLIDGPVGKGGDKQQKLAMAETMLCTLGPALANSAGTA